MSQRIISTKTMPKIRDFKRWMTYLPLTVVTFLFSCGQTNPKANLRTTNLTDTAATQLLDVKEKPMVSAGKVRQFLWREDQYDADAKASVSTIVMNKEVINSLSDAERAALGYVVTFIGSDCDWEDDQNNEGSNLKCKALTALKLGYQCSDEHLGFLRKWFKTDSKAVKALLDCPIIPFTATSQTTFDFINLTTTGNKISVTFAANGVNMRAEENWSWAETNHFEFDEVHINLVKVEKSAVERTRFHVTN